MMRNRVAFAVKMTILKYHLTLPLAILYWLILSFSDGSLEYYRQPMRKFFSAVIYTGNFHNFLLLSGIYWFPSSHFGFSFPLFQSAVSIILSTGIWIILKDMSRSEIPSGTHQVFVTGSTISGAVITTGACCTVPFIFPLLDIISQSLALSILVFLGTYSDIMDLFIFIAIIFFHIKMTSEKKPRQENLLDEQP